MQIHEHFAMVPLAHMVLPPIQKAEFGRMGGIPWMRLGTTLLTVLGAVLHSQRSSVARKRAEAQRDEYAVGTPVTVYFDPQAPENCLLDPAVPANLSRSGLGLLGVFAAGVFMLMMGREE